MIKNEATKFIDVWRKLSPDKRKYFTYMIMGAAFVAGKTKNMKGSKRNDC